MTADSLLGMPARLQRDAVQAVYRALLRRDAAEAEIDARLAALESLEQFLHVVLDSEEYAIRGASASAQPTLRVVNSFHPDLARWTLPPGTRSADGIAVVGHEGWLFLASGTNAIVDQFTGAKKMAPGWLKGWSRLMERRQAAVRTLGARMAMLILPDKLAVLEEHYPRALHRTTRRPIERLLGEAQLPIAYPLTELRAAAADGPVCLRTDTHFALRGNELLSRRLCLLLGVAPQFGLGGMPRTDGLTSGDLGSGDLGSRFDPPVVEPVVSLRGTGHAHVLEDNRAEIAAVGGHIGTCRVFANAQAPDPRTLVLFGDSYGFSSETYHGLSFFLAQQFRRVHFVWVPVGWDPRYVEQAEAELVVFQSAERFVSRLPRDEVDVRALAAETIRRRRAAGIETAFAA